MKGFVHLRNYSDYSLGFSTIKTKDLVGFCKKQLMPAAALTDRNNLFGALEFAEDAIKSGIQPINGLELTLRYNSISFTVLCLAKNEQGYVNLMYLSSQAFLERHSAQDQVVLDIEYLLKHSEGLVVLAAAPATSYEYLYFKAHGESDFSLIQRLHEVLADNLYIELIRSVSQTEVDFEYESKVLNFAAENNIPIVATNACAFASPNNHEAREALSCIIEGRYLDLTADEVKPEDFYLKSSEDMSKLFSDLPEAIDNTLVIARKCAYASPSRKPLLPKYFNDASTNEELAISQYAEAGLRKRISQLNYSIDEPFYFERLKFELSVINKMQYAGYFLIVSDFIKWSKENDIPVGPGRGSGAGSIVAWALQITDLDPIKFGLLFERFLNPDRVSMPDFDIDFCQERREEVIEYVQKRYGQNKVAQIITFGKLQARAVLRDVGRVIHMPYPAVDKICKMVPNNPANPVTLKQAIDLDKELQKSRDNDPQIEKLLEISLQLEGLNRHASTHAAGIVIADRPIVELVPLYKDFNAKMPAVQFSMKYAENAGLIKFDFLGLKTLTVISQAVKLIKEKGIDLDINAISLDDPKTYELLSRGDTAGVFQFESAGMRETIKKLKPDSIEDLIALGSLYRPGPMDNIPSYINRKHGLEKPEYLHPSMESILKETFGIIVYQEQVMEIARVVAGYSLGAADLLRRAMGKKIKAEMEAQRAHFVEGCLANSIDKQTANELFALIEKFASYGFNKSHAAAYAIISYQTAYLKANYPLEFFVASINLELHDSDKINLFLSDVRGFQIPILPPCLNHSQALFSVEGDAIRFGLGAIKNVGLAAISNVVEKRKAEGFKDLPDFLSKVSEKDLNKRLLEGLIKSGAFECFGHNRLSLLSSLEAILNFVNSKNSHSNSSQVGLFGDIADEENLVIKDCLPPDGASLLSLEFEAFGFYLSKHPTELYTARLAKLGVSSLARVQARASSASQKHKIVGAITSRKVRSSKRGKYAFIQLSDPSGLMDVSIFNEDLLQRYDAEIKVGNLLFMSVDVRLDDNGFRAIADEIKTIEHALKYVDTRYIIHVDDKAALPHLKVLMGDVGKEVELTYKCPEGNVVIFRSNQMKLRIPEQNEGKLMTVAGIRVVEV